MFGFQAHHQRRFQRMIQYLRSFTISIFLISTVIVISVLGLILIEGYTLGDAIYMTVITISTVGYGEVQPLSSIGRLFMSFIIIINLGTFAYAVSTISAFIIEGQLQTFLKEYWVNRQIDKFQNHVIICGFGRHGKQIANELYKQNIPFLVIDKNNEKIKELRQKYNFVFLEGDATQDEILEEGRIYNAKALVVTLPEDADSLYVVLSARQLNPKLHIISRALDLAAEKKLIRAGANHVVMPERIGGFYMATLINKPEVVEFLSLFSKFGSTKMGFEEIDCSHLRKHYQSKTIKELNIRRETGANIIGLRDEQGHYIVNPGPDTLIRSGMFLIVFGDTRQLDLFKKTMIKLQDN